MRSENAWVSTLKKLLFSVTGIVLLVLSIDRALAWDESFRWSWRPEGFFPGTFLLIPLILMIAFWVAVLIGIVFFVKWIISLGRTHETKAAESALDILKKRYARGEISKEEFERMKQDIQ